MRSKAREAAQQGTMRRARPAMARDARATSADRLQRAFGNEAVQRMAGRHRDLALSPPVQQALHAAGHPLPAGVRAQMEARFVHDFGNVRVHVGADAVAAADALDAHAFTVGTDIVFGAGQFAPGTTSGSRLLAHELAHVIQQGRGGACSSAQADAFLEAGAEQASAAVARGTGPVAVDGSSAVAIARQSKGLAGLDPTGKYPHTVIYRNWDDYSVGEGTQGVQNSDGTVTAIVYRPYPQSAMVAQEPTPKAVPAKPRPHPSATRPDPVDVHLLRELAEAMAPKLVYPKPVRQFFGGVQFLGGGLEAGIGGVGGLATAETGVGLFGGAFLLAHGADVASSGWTTMWTGEESKTYTFMTGAGWALAAGADPKLASAVGQSTDLIANIGAAGLSLRLPAAPLIELSPQAELELELAQLTDLQARPRFGVDFDLRWQDIGAGVLTPDGYIMNPRLQELASLVNSEGKLGPRNFGGVYMYVIDEQGVIRIGSRAGQRMPHPTLVGGDDPFALAAGEIDIRRGQIYSINNLSGHFRPSPSSLGVTYEVFSQLPDTVFSRNFQGFRVFHF
jgi:hypothetical protein